MWNQLQSRDLHRWHRWHFDSISGVFQCVREMNNDCEDVYVDGGLLCNYPIHAFDGMYLALKFTNEIYRANHIKGSKEQLGSCSHWKCVG